VTRLACSGIRPPGTMGFTTRVEFADIAGVQLRQSSYQLPQAQRSACVVELAHCDALQVEPFQETRVDAHLPEVFS